MHLRRYFFFFFSFPSGREFRLPPLFCIAHSSGKYSLSFFDTREWRKEEEKEFNVFCRLPGAGNLIKLFSRMSARSKKQRAASGVWHTA